MKLIILNLFLGIVLFVARDFRRYRLPRRLAALSPRRTGRNSKLER